MQDFEAVKQDAVACAERIFSAVINNGFLEIGTPHSRHEFLAKKYPEFTNAYPLVISKMAEGLYITGAFIQFLDNNILLDPGKGMDGFIERQAEYVMFLYIHQCKKKNMHVNMKTARDIKQSEYATMRTWVKQIEKSEREAKKSVESEKKLHVQELKDELMNFLDNEG